MTFDRGIANITARLGRGLYCLFSHKLTKKALISRDQGKQSRLSWSFVSNRSNNARTAHYITWYLGVDDEHLLAHIMPSLMFSRYFQEVPQAIV